MESDGRSDDDLSGVAGRGAGPDLNGWLTDHRHRFALVGKGIHDNLRQVDRLGAPGLGGRDDDLGDRDQRPGRGDRSDRDGPFDRRGRTVGNGDLNQTLRSRLGFRRCRDEQVGPLELNTEPRGLAVQGEHQALHVAGVGVADHRREIDRLGRLAGSDLDLRRSQDRRALTRRLDNDWHGEDCGEPLRVIRCRSVRHLESQRCLTGELDVRGEHQRRGVLDQRGAVSARPRLDAIRKGELGAVSLADRDVVGETDRQGFPSLDLCGNLVGFQGGQTFVRPRHDDRGLRRQPIDIGHCVEDDLPSRGHRHRHHALGTDRHPGATRRHRKRFRSAVAIFVVGQDVNVDRRLACHVVVGYEIVASYGGLQRRIEADVQGDGPILGAPSPVDGGVGQGVRPRDRR